MRTCGKMVLVLGLAAVLTVSAQAQRQRPGGGGFGRGGGGLGMLLQNKSVQEELKLSEEQIKKVGTVTKEIREKHKDEFEALQKLDRTERREKGQELYKTVNAETEKGLAGVLNTDQSKRIKEIQLQVQGTRALTNPDVAKQLKLTDDQQSKLKTINEDSGKEMREIFQNAGNDRDAARKKMTELRKETKEKVMAVLTDDQKKTFKEMTGKPFEIKFEGGFGAGGGRRQGGRRPGGARPPAGN